jgi:putative transposase
VRASLGRHIGLYNARRPHSNLDRQTPDRACFNRHPLLAAA